MTKSNKTKDTITEKTKEIWQGKGMLGQFPGSLDEKFMVNEQSY
jgi:hypothetical protein